MGIRPRLQHRPGRGRWFRLSGRRLTVLPLALLVLACSVGITGTFAAWTATDAMSASTLSTNTILLADNQGGEGGTASNTGTAIFNVSNMFPGGAATTACVGLKISGTATASNLSMAATLGGAGQATLQSQLTMTTATYNTSGTVSVTAGSNTNNGSCASYPAGGTNTTVGTQGATLQTWAGAAPYAIASPSSDIWYKFTVSGLPAGDNTCATYCSKTITLTLAWTLTAA
jgi:predicted ribosomally synthesized peptide with SipW-like signal peptide